LLRAGHKLSLSKEKLPGRFRGFYPGERGGKTPFQNGKDHPMKMMKLFVLCACVISLALFCGKNKGTNPVVNQPGTVFDWSDTLALRAILDANGRTDIAAGSSPIVVMTMVNGNIHRIKELTLQNKGITIIPARIKELTAMQILRLDTNGITTLPPEIGSCSSLVRIQLSYNQLATVPAEISSLHHLSGLVLSHNSITALPQSLWTITSLEQLYLDYNQLTAIPTDVSNLTLLAMLALNNNVLTTLPSSLTNLTNLAISIDNNNICPNTLPTTFAGWIDNRAETDWRTTQGTCP
jgi:Leucine-rich repeat (LRR) protein